MGEPDSPGQRVSVPLTRTLPWLVLAVVVFVGGLRYLWPLTIDDAFISARYARNLAAGYGLTYNPGDPPSEGYSNLTLVLMTAAITRLGGEAITAAKAVGAASGLLTLLFIALAGRRLLPRYYAHAVLLTATSFPLLCWSVLGLETSLMALLAAMWLYLGARQVSNPRPGVGWLLAGVTVLAAATRPEGLLFLPALVVLNVLARQAGAVSWWPAMAALVVLAGGEAWRVWYFGRWLPLPYYAKVEVASLTDKLGGAYYLHAFLWWCGAGLAGYLALLQAWLTRRHTAAGRIGFVALLAIAPFTVFVLAAGADWMPQYRFLVPAIAPLALLLVRLLVSVREGVAQVAPHRAPLVYACALGVLLLGNAAEAFRALDTGDWRSTFQERLEYHRGASEALHAQGLWLRDHGGPRLIVAALDIGAPAYYSDAHIIDMAGLTNPDLAGQDEEAVADYVLRRRPDFIQTHGHAVERHAEFRTHYRRTSVPWHLYERVPNEQ